MACIFCRIVSGEIPTNIIYEDEFVCAFRDISPVAPVHVVLISKDHLERIDTPGVEKIAGHVILAISKLAATLGLSEDGFRVVNNAGKYGGQMVNHLHFHLLGGRHLEWPPG
ncbi:MAG: HIT-like protein [Bacillota bacterium]|nr:MAG: HIT-like protein [Bacillota bacterium]MBS3951209.1 histidine triad nucleotide-binding protein [Peptococcaceae bacterium]